MKRTSKELKRIARDILNDRYRVPMAAFAATTLIATVIESPFSFSMGDNPTNMQLVISLIAELLISVVSFVLGCGVAKIHLSMTRGNDFRIRDIFDPFKKNTDRFFIAGFLFLLMIFVSMIPVIGGFTYAVIADFSVVSIVIAAATGILSLILSCYFMLTYHFIGYITLDHPELKCLEVFKECRLLMHGNRLRLLYILLSFIGYGLLVLCSFGIASLWFVPYQTETLVIFYLDCTDELNRIPVRSYEKTATTQF